MKTYQDNGYRYWYDPSLRSWTIIPVDGEGNQIGSAGYTGGGRKFFHKAFPMLKFKPLK